MGNNKSVSILGCGWLGLPLAKSFLSDTEFVKGSTTTTEKLPVLAASGIAPYLVQFTDERFSGNLSEFLDAEVLIIAVSPGRSAEKQRNYLSMLSSLATMIPRSTARKVVFISSTAVYGDANREFTEDDDPQTDSSSGELLMKAEKLVSSVKAVQHVVLRVAGLVGPGRHPGRFFTGKKGIPNGLAPVNLVHQADVIGVIKLLANDEGAHGIYNVCAPHHPQRQVFYSAAAENAGLDLPGFIPENKSWKVISSNRIGSELKYTFQVPDLLEGLKTC